MPYPDLGTMYQNGMGSLASFMGGQQASLAREQDQVKLQQMQQEMQHADVMNPLNAQFKQGQIAQQGAELPGIQGQAASHVAKGMEDLGLVTQRMAAKLSTMSTQIGNDGMVKMGQDGEKLSHAAQIIKQYPPHMQKALFAKAIQQYGGSMDSPMMQGVLQAPDDKFQLAAETMGKSMALAGQKYQQESATAKEAQGSRERMNDADNASSQEIAKIQAASREAVGRERSRIHKTMKDEDVLRDLERLMASGEATDEDRETYRGIMARKLSLKAAGVPTLAPNVMNQDTVQQTAQKTAAELAKPKAAPAKAPAAPANLPSGYKYAGTIKGVPTYENAEGKRIQWGGK